MMNILNYKYFLFWKNKICIELEGEMNIRYI